MFGTIFAKMGICLPDSCSTTGDVKEGLLELEESLQTENVTWKFLIVSCQDQYDLPVYGTEDIIMLWVDDMKLCNLLSSQNISQGFRVHKVCINQ